jgi:hypothetical protein
MIPLRMTIFYAIEIAILVSGWPTPRSAMTHIVQLPSYANEIVSVVHSATETGKISLLTTGAKLRQSNYCSVPTV